MYCRTSKGRWHLCTTDAYHINTQVLKNLNDILIQRESQNAMTLNACEERPLQILMSKYWNLKTSKFTDTQRQNKIRVPTFGGCGSNWYNEFLSTVAFTMSRSNSNNFGSKNSKNDACQDFQQISDFGDLRPPSRRRVSQACAAPSWPDNFSHENSSKEIVHENLSKNTSATNFRASLDL